MSAREIEWQVDKFARQVQGVAWGRVCMLQCDVVAGIVRARGRVRIHRLAPTGRIVLGDRVQFERGVSLTVGGEATIEIGDRVYVNDSTRIGALSRVEIGSRSMLAAEVSIMDSNFHRLDGSLGTAPVVIGEHAWLGSRSMVLPGVTVGDGAVIAAGSVVSRDVEPGTLVAGNPAQVLRRDVEWSPDR
jgi:acetyltransferase-like isoleucine patch superfamily enzyme